MESTTSNQTAIEPRPTPGGVLLCSRRNGRKSSFISKDILRLLPFFFVPYILVFLTTKVARSLKGHFFRQNYELTVWWSSFCYLVDNIYLIDYNKMRAQTFHKVRN